MNAEEKIREALIAKFSLPENQVEIPRIRRLNCAIEPARLKLCLDFLIKEFKFINLAAITGSDEGQNLSVIYHLSQDAGIVLNLKTLVAKDNPVLDSLIGLFPSAEVYEREIVDLLGFKVSGLPQGSRYPLTDDWPQGEYPLRKDWKPKDK